MPTYGYVVSPSAKRGYNKNVRVYRIVNNKPKFLAEGDYQSASWRDAKGEAQVLIQKKEGYKQAPRGYGFVRKDVELFEL